MNDEKPHNKKAMLKRNASFGALGSHLIGSQIKPKELAEMATAHLRETKQ